MQAVKARYKKGQVELLAPLQGVTEAELLVIVLDKEDLKGEEMSSHSTILANSAEEFKALGLVELFDSTKDNNVDWEDMFDAKTR